MDIYIAPKDLGQQDTARQADANPAVSEPLTPPCPHMIRALSDLEQIARQVI